MYERYIPFSGRNNEYRAEQRNKANLYAPPFACSHRFMITIKHYSLRSGIALALLLCAFFSMRGQVRFSCDAPRQVVAGEQFQVRFVLDGAQGSGFSTSSFEGIEVVFPPANAVSVANVNGHVTTIVLSHLHRNLPRTRKGQSDHSLRNYRCQRKTLPNACHPYNRYACGVRCPWRNK